MRVAIAGAGLMGRWHAQAAARAGAIVAGVCDPAVGAADALARRLPGATAFDEIGEMLVDCRPEVLHICSPLASHAAVARAALDAGTHVLVEKPAFADYSETVGIYDLARDRGLLVCPVHQFPFQDGARAALRDIDRLGRIVHLEAVVCSAGGTGLEGDALDALGADILPHPLSLARRFLPGRELPDAWQTRRPRAGELRAYAERDGVSIAISISLHARPTVCAFRADGEAGRAHLDLFLGSAFFEHGAVSRARKATRPFGLAARGAAAAALALGRRMGRWEPAYPGLGRLVADLYDAVRCGGASPVPEAEALEIAQIRDQIAERAVPTAPEQRVAR